MLDQVWTSRNDQGIIELEITQVNMDLLKCDAIITSVPLDLGRPPTYKHESIKARGVRIHAFTRGKMPRRHEVSCRARYRERFISLMGRIHIF